MRFAPLTLSFWLAAATAACAASNSVVNLSHYDRMQPDFHRMKGEGIQAVIHEATYPPFVRDAAYAPRQQAAARAGLLWGAYHFANATDPIRQADHFVSTVEQSWRTAGASGRPGTVLLVLDFEKNGHYPGGTMRVDQAVLFAERIRQRTGVYPGIYSNEYRIQTVLANPRITAAQKRVLTNCWLWIANYHRPPRQTSPWSNWTLWQYTGDGVCDLRPRSSYPKSAGNMRHAERNFFRGSGSGLASFWQAHAWTLGESGE